MPDERWSQLPPEERAKMERAYDNSPTLEHASVGTKLFVTLVILATGKLWYLPFIDANPDCSGWIILGFPALALVCLLKMWGVDTKESTRKASSAAALAPPSLQPSLRIVRRIEKMTYVGHILAGLIFTLGFASFALLGGYFGDISFIRAQPYEHAILGFFGIMGLWLLFVPPRAVNCAHCLAVIRTWKQPHKNLPSHCARCGNRISP